jgi:hypothetical protein
MQDGGTLTIHLQGGFRIVSADHGVNGLEYARLQDLLAYLLLQRGRPVPRQHLSFLFWPDASEKQARTTCATYGTACATLCRNWIDWSLPTRRPSSDAQTCRIRWTWLSSRRRWPRLISERSCNWPLFTRSGASTPSPTPCYACSKGPGARTVSGATATRWTGCTTC